MLRHPQDAERTTAYRLKASILVLQGKSRLSHPSGSLRDRDPKGQPVFKCRQEFPPPAWYALGQADGQGWKRQMVTSDATKTRLAG